MTEFLTNDRISDMKLFVLSILFFHPGGTCSAIAAIDTLPPAPALHAALDTFLKRQLVATLAEFDDDNRGAWMNYVPSVGIGYNLATDKEGQITSKPRPTVSFSLAQVFNARRQRRDRQAKRKSLIATTELQRQQLHSQLSAMLQRCELMNLELATMRRVHAIERQLYELAVIDYEAAKLAPSGFLPKEKTFLESELSVMRKEMELKGLESDVLKFVGFE